LILSLISSLVGGVGFFEGYPVVESRVPGLFQDVDGL
jgi:hypothetical protein